MDELLKLASQYLPLTIIIAIGMIYGAFKFIEQIVHVVREIKEVFFDDEHHTKESFMIKMKYFMFPWIKREKRKIIEPKNIKYTDEERAKVVSNLLIHNFFQSVAMIRIRIQTMDFGYPKKTETLRDIIKIYVNVIEKSATNIIRNYKLDELDTAKLNEILVQEIDKANFEIYSKMRTRLGDALYTKLIEDPIKGFKARNDIFKEVFVNGVLLISTQAMSVYHYDNYERASEVLTSMYVSLNVIVKNFEKVFKDYNGELDQYLM
jgi:hypothetical protein